MYGTRTSERGLADIEVAVDGQFGDDLRGFPGATPTIRRGDVEGIAVVEGSVTTGSPISGHTTVQR